LLLMGKTEKLSTARRGKKGDLCVKLQRVGAPAYALFLEYRQLTVASIERADNIFAFKP
jgi:hypothetical protein